MRTEIYRPALKESTAGTPAGWSRLLLWAAIAVAMLQAVVGIAHFDREALAFAVLFAIGVVILARARQRRGVYTAAVIVLGLLFTDVAFWMITATWSNARNHEQLLYIVEPLALACASVAGLIAVAGRLLDRRQRAAQSAAAAVTIGAIATFVLCLGAAAVTGWGKEQTQGPNDLALRIHNTAYSSASITATSHQVTLYVTNDDLFWHTVTIDQLAVELPLPVGSHRRITFTAPSGTYTFYCRIPGHRQAGMVGTITIP
ncbi:MAG TPA: cupredoxin domain-containing protein [Candidatus Dormibacteraeota bacterium]|nr:cupredoxin domain-containing protein [Candidatus Dormibacteraeota bacterium]